MHLYGPTTGGLSTPRAPKEHFPNSKKVGWSRNKSFSYGFAVPRSLGYSHSWLRRRLLAILATRIRGCGHPWLRAWLICICICICICMHACMLTLFMISGRALGNVLDLGLPGLIHDHWACSWQRSGFGHPWVC